MDELQVFSKRPIETNAPLELFSPAFEAGDRQIKIYHEDAIAFLSKLPSESVDLIVTDPAYSGMNQRLQLGRGRIIGKYVDKATSGKWFDEFHDTPENYNSFLSQCWRVLKKDRHIYLMFDSFSLLSLAPLVRDVFDVKNVIVWDKVNIGMGHYFRRRHELIVFASKGKRSLNSRTIPDVWRIKRVGAFKYPTQKPTEIFECMMAGSVEENFLVCDPFVGSGSSAIAAIRRNCQFIGCDSSEKAVSVASARIDQYLVTGKDSLQPKSLLVENESYKWLNLNGKSR
jgi:site-specific DNA-methyltransferase (adenine-specific)